MYRYVFLSLGTMDHDRVNSRAMRILHLRPYRFPRSRLSLTLLLVCIQTFVTPSYAAIPVKVFSLFKSWSTAAAAKESQQQSPESWNKDSVGSSFEEEVINVVEARSRQSESQDNIVGKNEEEQQTKTDERESKSLRDTMADKRLQFLDRIALVSSSLMRREADAIVETEDTPDTPPHDLEDVTPQSNLNLPGRHFHIVTTAALPWFTGTAVNPLLRAAHFHRRTQLINSNSSASLGSAPSNETAVVLNDDNDTVCDERQEQVAPPTRWVTLVIPWLELIEDQESLYGRIFDSQQAQENYIRGWLRNEAGMPDAACPETGLQILFYPARYHAGLGSIFAMGDIIGLLDPSKMDVCVLEEPEHCNWFRAPGDGWTKRFRFVVGVIHTSKCSMRVSSVVIYYTTTSQLTIVSLSLADYKEYASAHYSGLWTAPAISVLSSAMVRAYCHKVIKLSSVLQSYAPEKEATSNVHGVRDDFLREGERRAEQLELQTQESETETDEVSTRVYYIGKLLWAKGLDIMLELEDYYKQCTNKYFEIDIYGNGPDQKDIIKAFHGRRKDATDRRGAGDAQTSVISTTLSLFGGTAPSSNASSTSSDAANDSSLGDGESRERLKLAAKQHLKKIKQTINAVDIPKTFSELRRQPIPAEFPGRVDHGTLTEQYSVFVNPSISEVLCTTTSEALAMGKFAVIPFHPSNTFFLQFPNCLAYRNKFEFVANLRWALTHEPEPLTAKLARQFTWQAATDRFIDASAVSWKEALERERLGLTKLDERIAWFHNELGKGASGDMLRKFFGAGPASHQVKYQIEQQEGLESLGGGENEGPYEDEDDGLSGKFRRSSFAEAIRLSLGDLSLFIQ